MPKLSLSLFSSIYIIRSTNLLILHFFFKFGFNLAFFVVKLMYAFVVLVLFLIVKWILMLIMYSAASL